LLSRLDNKVEDAIVVVMQRLHTDDLAGYLIAQGGWDTLNLPAIAEFDEEIALGAGRFHLRRAGDVMHPEREPLHALDELRRSLGSREFSAQYQHRPVPIEGDLIKWAWFKQEDAPGVIPRDKIIVSWDTAMSGNELADYSACVVLQVRGERVHVLDVLRQRPPEESGHRDAPSLVQLGLRLRAPHREQGLGHESDPGPQGGRHLRRCG
jgi:hypothetical protein